jgi:muramoyltetrapeptide carboxypeptidase
MIIPKPLNPGDTIGIVAPSSPFKAGTLDDGIRYLKTLGYQLQFGQHYQKAIRFLAGLDEERAQDFMDFIQNPSIKAIMMTRGGYGSQRILPYLDFDLIQANPKMVVGFSDTTALQLALYQKAGLVSYTGFTLNTPVSDLIQQSLPYCLQGKSYQIKSGICVHPGNVEAPLIGGNLSLLVSLLGTPFQPNFKNSILLLEDVNVEPHNADRMFSHCELAGVFNDIKGLIVGKFANCTSKQENEGLIDDVITEWTERLQVPCLKEFPYTHAKERCVLPIGKTVRLDATNGVVSIP